ncbi:hypothetical protein OSTOST_21951, partial [Ostertagia ostertagi]
ANNKIHSVRESEAHPVNSEVVIRLAHQNKQKTLRFAPLYWLHGDPSRPFPTEPEFRASALAAPKDKPTSRAYRAKSFSLACRRTSVEWGEFPHRWRECRRFRCKERFGALEQAIKQASPSPRGRGGAQWAGRGGGPGGVSPFQKRTGHIGENSPRMVSPTVNINFVSPPPRMNPPPVNKVEQMSSDSSSSSSSDDESPK